MREGAIDRISSVAVVWGSIDGESPAAKETDLFSIVTYPASGWGWGQWTMDNGQLTIDN